MGVKSTLYITRAEAERYYIARLRYLSDSELEEIVERFHDSQRGGEGFENYIITDDEDNLKSNLYSAGINHAY